jgi:hypothetical protein
MRDALEQLGKEHMAEVDQTLIPRIKTVSNPCP